MNNRVIVSAAIGTPKYAEEFESTREHCTKHDPHSAQLFFTEYPEGCPLHADNPYAFKIFCIREAINRGYTSILWMDSAFQPIGSLDPLWQRVETIGWYVPPQLEADLGDWCSDDALKIFGIERTVAHWIRLVYSGIVGLDLKTPIGWKIWKDWEELCQQGAFKGPHVNLPGVPIQPWGDKWEGHVSDDATVLGHRHDESALSYVLFKNGLGPPETGFLTIEGKPNAFIGHHVPREKAVNA